MTQDERDQLDAICREAFAKLDELDLRAYQMGIMPKPQNSWGKRVTVVAPTGAKPKGKDIGGSKVLKPVTPPLLPPSDALARVQAFVSSQTIN